MPEVSCPVSPHTGDPLLWLNFGFLGDLALDFDWSKAMTKTSIVANRGRFTLFCASLLFAPSRCDETKEIFVTFIWSSVLGAVCGSIRKKFWRSPFQVPCCHSARVPIYSIYFAGCRVAGVAAPHQRVNFVVDLVWAGILIADFCFRLLLPAPESGDVPSN